MADRSRTIAAVHAKAWWSIRGRPDVGYTMHRDDDLAGLGPALLDVGHRLGCLLERERPVDDRPQHAGVIQWAELAQLGAAGLHEEELVAHIECPRPLADL